MKQGIIGKHTKSEILSQPQIWEDVLNSWQVAEVNDFPVPNNYDQVLYLGCGSTFYLSRWAARMNELISGVTSRAAPSSEILLYPDYWINMNLSTLLIASSRSAATTETIAAIEHFRKKFRGDVIVVTCNPNEDMGSQTQYVISADKAREKSIAQTRSFSSMMLSHAFLIQRIHPGNNAVKLREAGETLIRKYLNRITEIAHDSRIEKIFFLGSGPLYGLANECMLKMKEISLSYSESFHSMEFRHGPMAMVDQNTLVVSLLGEQGIDQELVVLKDMKTKGAKTIAIAESIPPNSEWVDDFITLASDLPFIWRSCLYLPLLQWLAYERGISKGLDPDHPNNLDAVVVLDE
jgi:glucosamine--fructose-6-phosphate aminotransferase (isomerizing)